MSRMLNIFRISAEIKNRKIMDDVPLRAENDNLSKRRIL